MDVSNADFQQEKALSDISKIIDNYGDIDKANAKTVECFIYYLDIPSDRNGLNQRFNQAK